MQTPAVTFDQLPAAVMELNRKMDALLTMLPMNNEPEPDKLLTIEELQTYLPEKPARQTIYGWVNNRLIVYEKYGRRLYFRKSTIDAWLTNGRRMQTN